MSALTSMDDTKILESYMAGDIDLEGEMSKAFELRGLFKDFHPLPVSVAVCSTVYFWTNSKR